MRTCPVCKRAPRADDPMEAVQQNGPEAPPEAQAFMVGVWGVRRVMAGGTLTVLACRDCAAKMRGEPLPDPKRWPDETAAGAVVSGPAVPPGAEVCAVCRLVMREGATVELMRLYPEDLGLPGWAEQAVREFMDLGDKAAARKLAGEFGQPMPGAYPCCPECVEKYRPAIHRRLAASGLIPAGAGVGFVAGDWLM